ncbi:aldehyde dehydrogenase [uncultured Algibacter sp.]|uniref:aldehyde dehydrogenase n=1 Tax=uncultured Algibacter sp. TaxID=298659 RepID=UPI002626C2A2|nr:aldehyde dehydrogenase [uncultured Algibacter sp.]
MNNLEDIIENQRTFFKSQQTKNIAHRLKLLKALKLEIESQEQAILDALKKDLKKSEFESYISEVGLVLSELNLVLKNLKKWGKPKRIKSSLLTFPSKDYIYKAPYGNTLIIAPWNYPFLLAMEPLIMAISAGNTVVLKPSELTKHTSKIITKIVEAVFSKSHAISIEGGVDLSTKLLKRKWDFIFFTGSTEVGKIVAKAAASFLTPVVLELGGKSPCIIDDTVDLKLIARRLVWGKLLNGGQTCIAPDYLIVKSIIKEKLIEVLKTEITKRYSDHPEKSPDFPRIINKNNTQRLSMLLEGANIIFGGDINIDNCYISPTLVDEPRLDSPIMQEEIFGPILPILSYDTEKDIERIISNSDTPLALYVFSKNQMFAENTINTYSFGGGVVNDLLIHFGNHRLPFGGVGSSGMGRYHGKFGFDTFTHEKGIMKRGITTDPSFRYPPYSGKLNLLKKIFKWLG